MSLSIRISSEIGAKLKVPLIDVKRNYVKLTYIYKVVINLRDFEGLSTKEVIRFLGIKEVPRQDSVATGRSIMVARFMRRPRSWAARFGQGAVSARKSKPF